MNILFRADAGIEIGMGHVMRCLTLADRLAACGHSVHFVCRDHPGNAVGQIAARGHRVSTLAQDLQHDASAPRGWLGASQEEDAKQSLKKLGGHYPDWVVTDHYSIGSPWEHVYRSGGSKVLAIDDLADRAHACDLLMDQTLGRRPEAYEGLVPERSGLLLGTRYALLRPDFAAARARQPARTGQLKRVLVTMGGSDPRNAALQALEAISAARWVASPLVDVVAGSASPGLASVKDWAARSELDVRIHVDVSNMAEIIAKADLAIGAAGGTAWERCCLGLPAIMIILADNQRDVALALAQSGAAVLAKSSTESITAALNRVIEAGAPDLTLMAQRAFSIVDGQGANRVVDAMLGA